MLDANIPKVIARLGDDDKVLDVGGWFRPFNRATHVVDVFPYEGRGTGGHQGPEKEWFSRETWVQHDICSRTPWPFEDKSFDFAICSHVLEDIRDPIWVCLELMRVAKRGYIEVPSIESELSRGMESHRWAGHQHHHWLVEFNEGNLIFHLKPHFLMARWKYHLPESFGARLTDEQRVQATFWDDRFEVEEMMIIHDSSLQWIEQRVRKAGGWPWWRYDLEKARSRIAATRKRAG